MISKTVIYGKSAKGTQAIATREHGLGPKLRSMLILIDGKRGFDELAKLGAMFGDPGQLLDELLAAGFIEEHAAAPPPVAAAPPPAPAITLVEAKRFASRRLTDLMGPSAEQLCLRIEASRTPQDFYAAVARAEAVVRDFGGAEMARTFMAEIQARRPGA